MSRPRPLPGSAPHSLVLSCRGLPAFLAAALLLPGPALALSEWRTEVQVSFGTGTGTEIIAGGPTVPSVSLSEDNGFGTASAKASSSLSALGFVPKLQVRAVHDGARAQAVAWGVQGYTNTTGAPIDTTLVLDLSANVVGANEISASVYLFETESFEFEKDRGTILFESSSQLWPGFEPFTNNFGPDGFDVHVSTSGAVNEQRQFAFTVDPGEGFYIWAMIVATADVLGEVDAFGTLTASLTNTEGLGVAPAAVPEPERALLVGLALTALGIRSGTGARRRT